VEHLDPVDREVEPHINGVGGALKPEQGRFFPIIEQLSPDIDKTGNAREEKQEGDREKKHEEKTVFEAFHKPDPFFVL